MSEIVPTPRECARQLSLGDLADALAGRRPARRPARPRQLPARRVSAASRRRRRDVVVAMWDAALAALSLAVIVASIAGAWWMLKIAEAR